MMNQRKYALELLTYASLLVCKPASTPIDIHTKLSLTRSVTFTDVQAYRKLIGRLVYLTNTRPDITFFVQQIFQFFSNPATAHYIMQ